MAENRKRNVLTFSLKKEIIDKIKNSCSRDEVVRDYNLCKSVYYDIIKKESEITECCDSFEFKNKKIKKSSPLAELDIPVNGLMIKEKAKIFNQSLEGPLSFKLSV